MHHHTMKLRLLIALLGVTTGLLYGAGRSDAAITCPSESLSPAVYHIGSGTLDSDWSARCTGAMWYINFTVQYEVNGQWNTANCANSSPCLIRRPSTGYYAGGETHSGTVTFDPLNGCNLRYRIRMALTGKGGNGFSFSSQPSQVC